MAGNPNSKQAVVLIHGLFVNSDHWRKTLKSLAKAGYRVYAVDLLGYGYSSKPHPKDSTSRDLVCGEYGRFIDDHVEEEYNDRRRTRITKNPKMPSVLKGITLGTANGGTRIASQLELKHPLSSPYNFFTWAEQIADFTRDVVVHPDPTHTRVTLVANSIGTISALQSVLDCPHLYNGVFSVSPNFRELHSAEVPLAPLSMPLIRSVQALLRSKGQGLFDTLAKPTIVKEILKEPYAIQEAVDDELVDALLTPLLLPGASDVVFDTLSYSAGPLPEQQLSDELFPTESVPVWICYGDKDPWTPGQRVENLIHLPCVERVVRLEGLGHCPHDEAVDESTDLVSPLLLEFLQRVNQGDNIK
jgi:pimeloyl-ACP methyl ester carboxylesterase